MDEGAYLEACKRHAEAEEEKRLRLAESGREYRVRVTGGAPPPEWSPDLLPRRELRAAARAAARERR